MERRPWGWHTRGRRGQHKEREIERVAEHQSHSVSSSASASISTTTRGGVTTVVENQHTKITGYRDLSEAEISAMNACKSVAIEVGSLCDRVEGMTGTDKRWVAIGRTQLQQGFMALIRSIAKPETF